MRKIFANLKSVVALAVVAAMTLSVSCGYDDTALTKRVDKVEKDLAALTERVNALENESLEDLLAGNLVITGVEKDNAGNTVLKLSDGSTVTVLAEAETLQYRTENGVLEISADGETWVAVTAAPECVVKSVVVNEDGSVTIVLANGTEATLGVAELIECAATRSQVYVIAETTKAVPFTINDAVEDINVMNQPFGWSATVEEATAEEDDDDFDMGVLAAGGTDYVLNITGPSQALVDAGMAAKEGLVSVHFNTAAGACKVMNVTVNLAELTLSIDNAGNITLVNTVATEQTNNWGEKFTDFADFFIGYMPKSEYLAFLAGEDYDPYSVEFTMRSSGFGNIIDLMQYVEGECEKETYTFTLDQYIQGIFYGEPVPVGSEYVVFVTIEHDGYYQPELSKAVTVEYKKTIVEASVVEGSVTWNDATLNLSLAGYTMYCVGWMSVDEFNMYNAVVGAASFEEFLPTWLGADMNYMRGVVLGEDMLDVNYTISELAMYGGASVLPGTEYYLYVYPFNAQTEMDLYQHQVIAENIVFCGTFETTALKVGQFEASAEYTIVEHLEDSISVDVKFAGDATTIVYNWINEPSLDPASTIAQMFADYYTQYVDVYEGTAEFNASHSPYNNIANPIYLAMYVINANGEYVYLEKEFTYIEPEPIALTSFEYQGRHLDIDDNPETSGGDHVYIAKAVDGTELTIGLYYTYADENGAITPGEYDYCANFFDAMYSYWNGFVIVGEAKYSGSKLIVTEDTVKIKIKGGNIYLFDKNAAPVEPEEPEEPEVTYDYDLAFTSATYAGGTLELKGADANDFLKLIVNPGLKTLVAGDYVSNGNYDYTASYPYPVLWTSADAKELDLSNSSYNMSANPAPYGQYYFSSDLKMSVALNGDVYSIVVTAISYIDGNKNVRFTYNGTIAAEAAGPDLTGYEEGTGASVDYKSESGTVRFKLTYIDEVVLQIYPFFGNESKVHFTVGEWQVETLTLSGFKAQSGTVDLYQQADGSYLVMVDATFQMVGAKKFYFYVTL